MTKAMALAVLVVTLTLTGFKFPTSTAQYWVTNSYTLPCIERLRDGVCMIPPDYIPCCHAILAETQSDRDCMCHAFHIDPTFKNEFRIHCDTFSDTLKLCTSGPPDSATSATPVPGVNLPLSPPVNQSSGTKNKTMKTIGGVVGSVVFMMLAVLSGIAISKCYPYFQCCICCNSYTAK